MTPAIRVEELGKLYQIGARETYRSLRESLTQAIFGRKRQDSPREFIWALRGVGFEVPAGEVLGIIGRNGAGKSTLLKVLSRITEPTEGSVAIHGRVGSLLEVGTGFHPELTGRENVYLNGAILGMRRAEIDRKFGEIVAFSEVEKFLDTPVKHYSSGMYTRLAFAVAAHLDPEILVVDEVLAVGDAAFQRKCLGKMGDVARGGRTVLFVSHNMAAIENLCERCLVMDHGQVVFDGPARDAVSTYLRSVQEGFAVPLEARTARRGSGALRLTSFELLDERGEPAAFAISGRPAAFRVGYRCPGGEPVRGVRFVMLVEGVSGQPLFYTGTDTGGGDFGELPPQGSVVCRVRELPLAPGRYGVSLYAAVRGETADSVKDAAPLDVVMGDFYGSGRMPGWAAGPLLVRHEWLTETAGARVEA